MSDLAVKITLVAVLIPSVVLHEIAHGLVADRLGDPTARQAGRLTLNPLRHVDPVGTVLLPLVLALTTSFVIGFAKPVPVSVARLRNPRRDSLLVALAGPLTNFGLAFVAVVVFRLLRPGDSGAWWTVLALVTVVNVILGLFNLIPLPPLDGSAVIEFLLPSSMRAGWYRLRRYALPVALVALFMARPVLDQMFQWSVEVWRAQQ